ncbi:MAG: ribokinase [Fuerstiella sp.]
MSSEADRPPRILVVGSINMDLVVRSARLPAPGETLTGRSLQETPGGKGANQAVAAARLGAQVSMIGRLGEDGFGRVLRQNLAAEGITLEHVLPTAECSSGVAIIGVEDSGQNCITVIPAANGRLTPDDIEAHQSAFTNIDLLMLQLEVPLDTVLTAQQLARERSIPILLDPAPAVADFPAELLHVDYLCPNESEAALLTGRTVETIDDAEQAALTLKSQGANVVIVTLGDRGVVCCTAGQTNHVAPTAVSVVDTTAAGDAFAAALAVQVAAGTSIKDAVRFACAAGALAASREGAQPAMPSLADVQQLANRSGNA